MVFMGTVELLQAYPVTWSVNNYLHYSSCRRMSDDDCSAMMTSLSIASNYLLAYIKPKFPFRSFVAYV
jgi:hypothetical protein